MTEYITEWASHNIEDPFVREEIVRCRDCMHMGYGMWGDKYPMVCKRRIRAYQVQPDGFCAWGKRKEY